MNPPQVELRRRNYGDDDDISIDWLDEELLQGLDIKLGEEECKINASTDASLAKAANECFRKKMSVKKFQGKLNKDLLLHVKGWALSVLQTMTTAQLRVPIVSLDI